jgi:hypothetical protein
MMVLNWPSERTVASVSSFGDGGGNGVTTKCALPSGVPNSGCGAPGGECGTPLRHVDIGKFPEPGHDLRDRLRTGHAA